jgi:PhnB protein
MPSVNPYLNFNDNCEEAFSFYKSVFGGEFMTFSRFKDVPAGSSKPMPESEGKKVMHVALPIGSATVLMGSDTPEYFGKVIFGNNFSISVSADSEQQANKFYSGLSAGGKATMPMDKAFWGSYFGMLTDKFGINWMVSYDYNQNK